MRESLDEALAKHKQREQRQAHEAAHQRGLTTEAEGLMLHLCSSSVKGPAGRTGYKGVYRRGANHEKPYAVTAFSGGASQHLGYYTTDVEGAVAYARFVDNVIADFLSEASSESNDDVQLPSSSLHPPPRAPSTSRGARKRSMEPSALATKRHSVHTDQAPPSAADDLATAPTCTICLDELDSTQRWGTTPCGHSFHEACLRTWVTDTKATPNNVTGLDTGNAWTNKGCPECRYRLVASTRRMMAVDATSQ